MPRHSQWFLLSILALSPLALSTHPDVAAAPKPASPNAPAAPNSGDDTVSYQSGPSKYIDKQKLWQMSGGVKFTQEDAHLDTQAALVNLDKDMNAQTAKSLAPVHVYDSQNDLTGDHGFLDFTRHLATLHDHITLIARPGGENSADGATSQFKDPATLTCDTMTYDYKSKIGTVPGPLVVHQTDRVLTADSGVYNGTERTVTLTGNVHAKQSDGSEIFAPKLVAGVEKGNEWIYVPGPIHGTFKSKKDNDKAAPAPAVPVHPAAPPDLDLPADTSGTTGTAAPATPAATPPSQPATGAVVTATPSPPAQTKQ